jgi:WS/DGAT/MGAT family acyltransferase
MSLPLDFTRPPWKFYIIENYGTGCAVMARLHHCLADGMALMAIFLAMTDLNPDAPLVPTEPADAQSANGLLGGLAREAFDSVDLIRRSADRAFQGLAGLIEEPRKGRELGEFGLGYGLAATRLLARRADPRTQFKGRLGVMKRAAWSRPIPLSDVKLVKNMLGGTINDVLVSVLAGGLRRYLAAATSGQAGAVGVPEFRAAVPVNLREESDNGKLGNKFGLVFLTLPVGIEDPLMRLVEVRRRMDELKRSAEAPVTLGVLGMMGVGTDAFREMVVRLLEPKATVVLTNVPGPPVPLYLAGQQIREVMFWVPQAGRLGVGLSILSYAGQIYLGVATDAGLVANPELIIDGVIAEFDRLKAIAEAVQSTA